MSSQYSEGNSFSSANDYGTLQGYYQATPTPLTSEMSYIPSSGELKYLNMQRLKNIKLPLFVPRDYNTLESNSGYISYPFKGEFSDSRVASRWRPGMNGLKREAFIEADNYRQQ